MNKRFFITKIMLLTSLLTVSACSQITTDSQTASNIVNASTFTLTSTDIKPNRRLAKAQVFNGFGCTGDNLSPQLSWANAPRGTKSFAITAYDPDAPTGSGWWHWMVVNIPTHVTSVTTGAASQKQPIANALHARNDYGKYSFGGACPPKGDKAHRYHFTVWALNVDKLPVTKESSATLVGYFLNQHKLEKATLTAYYSR